jgi:hypothetical protein
MTGKLLSEGNGAQAPGNILMRRMSLGAILLEALLCLCGASQAVANPQAIAIEITALHGRQPVLVTHGSNAEQLGAGRFAINATLFRIPCPGRYELNAELEDLQTGGTTAYSAELVLSNLSPQSVRASCELTFPASVDDISVVLSGHRAPNPFDLMGRRGGFSNLIGSLNLEVFPSCATPYELRSSLVLGGQRRTFFYKARFIQAELLCPGNSVEPSGCEP